MTDKEIPSYPGFIAIDHAEAGCKNKDCPKQHWKADLTTTREELPSPLRGEIDFLTSIATCIISGHPIRSMIFSMISDEKNAERDDVGQLVALVDKNDQQKSPSYPHQTMLYGKALEDTPLINAALNVATEALARAKRQVLAERTPVVPVPPSRSVLDYMPPDVEMLEPPTQVAPDTFNPDPFH